MRQVLVSGRLLEMKIVSLRKYVSFRGDYRNCDLPYWTAETILKYIAENEKVADSIQYSCMDFYIFRSISSITLVICHHKMYGNSLVLINSMPSVLSISC